jgi:chromosome partitioning protein
MRSIAVINQKGGVGKTTTAVNLGAALAAAGQRVGLIDIDPQAHASLHLGSDSQRSVPNVYNLLMSDLPLHKLWQPACENLSVATAHIDFVLVDCPPSLGILTLNALSAVDDVFLPLQPHFLALHGLSKLLQTIGLVAERLNERLQLAGVVLCMYESGTRLATEVSKDVEGFFQEARRTSPAWKHARLFETRIRRNIRLAEAPSFGQSIFQYAAKSRGAEDYRALAGEVLAYYAGRDLLTSVTSHAA